MSLVAFEFLDTRVKGIRWPGFVNFPEWNLRFYVRTRPDNGEPRRGVVFIREFVPSRIIASIAKSVYNEPYAAAEFRHQVTRTADGISACYTVHAGGREHTLRATARNELTGPAEGSPAHLLIEQRWGYGRSRRGKTLCYEVTHPRWRVFSGAACRPEVDWTALYGPEWAALQRVEPFSTLLVEGSEITVSPAERC